MDHGSENSKISKTEEIDARTIEKEIFKNIPQCCLTGNYENNGIYTIYNPGTFIDNSCRERKVDWELRKRSES